MTEADSDAAFLADDTDVEAIVYDLDGTLVDLVVDWNLVAEAVADVLADVGVDADGVDLWEMIDLGDDAGIADEVEATIASYEQDGARISDRLPLADVVADADVPVGVCSLNCEKACRIALSEHELADDVHVVVGRDTVDTKKPDPEPLLEAARQLGVEPENVLFLGDSPRDEQTAEHAGTQFKYV